MNITESQFGSDLEKFFPDGRISAGKIIHAVKDTAKKQFRFLASQMKQGKYNSLDGNICGQFILRESSRLYRALCAAAQIRIQRQEMDKVLRALQKKYAPDSRRHKVYLLSGSEVRLAYMHIEFTDPAAVPGIAASSETQFTRLWQDKNISCYGKYIIGKFLRGEDKLPGECDSLSAAISELEKTGKCLIARDEAASKTDLLDALRKLGVPEDVKMVVHSGYASLGGVQGGPAAVAQSLIEYCGENGVLMMPSFDFPYYLGKNNDTFFDLKETPSCVGAVTDEFRKLPEVVRSLNPSHSIAVYGRKNFHWIKDHHKTLTMGKDSPLGKLERSGGYALMIHCPDSVTFMHVVEMSHHAHCLGYRNEEYNTKLPDGRILPVRTWGWRNGECPAYDQKAIFQYLRKYNLIKEVMVRHSLWQFFKLADYRKAYEKVVIHSKHGCSVCPLAPRKDPHCVEPDWDMEKYQLKDSTAFTGDWEY